jgi:glycosyltransferase involved in cell wall biosynthesis
MTTSQPRISIITPSFQQARFIDATIQSIISQGYSNLEYIVVDGGSTDGSDEVIRKYESDIAWWCCEKDKGQTNAINKGLMRATGEIVGWINSDDMMLPGSLERIAQAFDDSQVDAICGWIIAIDEHNRRIDHKIFPQPTKDVILSRSILPQQGVFWRKSVTDRIGMLDEEMHMCMDLEYWTRMACNNVIPRMVPAFLGAFRMHEDQKTQIQLEKWHAEQNIVFSRALGKEVDYRSLKARVPAGWRFRYNLLKRAAKLGWPGLKGPSAADLLSR